MIELEPDDLPRSGRWTDPHDFLASLSDEDRSEGQSLGDRIDTDDDDDNGGFR